MHQALESSPMSPSTSTATTPGPVVGNFATAFLRSIRHPEWMPQGVNDWDTPLRPGQVPVVLIHGTWLNAYNTYAKLAPTLAEAGYRVFALNYGRDTSCYAGRPEAVFASRALLDSRKEIKDFVEKVLDHFDVPQVDLIGHSQGVAQARLYLTDSGGADPEDPSRNRVRKLIGISGSNHGTTMVGSTKLSDLLTKMGVPMEKIIRRVLGQAALDQMVGAEAIKHLNRMGDTSPGIQYTMLSSRFDQIVTPWRTQFLECPAEPADSQPVEATPGDDPVTDHEAVLEVSGSSSADGQVRNLVLQDDNPWDFSDHLSILYSPRALDLILEVLDEDPLEYRNSHPSVRGTVLPTFGQVKVPRTRLKRKRQN